MTGTRKLVDHLFRMLRIVRGPLVKAYDGYGDSDDVLVYGHVLTMGPLPRKRYRQNLFINLFALVRLFIVRPLPGARVIIEWNGETKETFTDHEGFFRFGWKPLNPVEPGWHPARVSYVSPKPLSAALASAECRVFAPHAYQYNFISDIDDTFLVSHSANLAKRLKVLFTRNARSRRPFDGVAEHYRLLSGAATSSEIPNPFFYVSSSEWNLYDYIREFCARQGLPQGVYMLSRMKSLRDLLSTGQGKHMTKYVRIARIIKSYPHHHYVLLGDDTQEDPSIYFAVARDFPGLVKWIYIRNVSGRQKGSVKEMIRGMERLGVKCCYFAHSAEAIAHSRETGLIAGATR